MITKKSKIILGIETSCDETAAAIIEFDGENIIVLNNTVASQIPLHRLTGGVVPEVAAREHVTTIIPVIKKALKDAGYKLSDVDAIAATAGPGLLPALMVGVDTANALHLATGIPVLPIQHITGHIYANFVSNSKNQKLKIKIDEIEFPLVALIVSGGHTEFILMKDHMQFKKIGATLDDAAGEAFDKTAKILGLPYPGGPQISKLAEKGNPKTFDFPRPMLDNGDLNFSFSGLKTAVLYKVQEINAENAERHADAADKSASSAYGSVGQHYIPDLAASVQQAIIDTLLAKTEQALLNNIQIKSFTIGGGVAANKLLQSSMKKLLAEKFPQIKYYETKLEYTTDNAAMIAAAGAVKMHLDQRDAKIIKVDPRWEL